VPRQGQTTPLLARASIASSLTSVRDPSRGHVAHDDEAREDKGISPVEMTLFHTFIQWNWSLVLPESRTGLKISRPSPWDETLVPSDYSKK
jgi:hypothetical protein